MAETTLKTETIEAIRTHAKRFPEPSGALLTSLRMAEREVGFVNADVCAQVADALEMAPAKVWGVLSFYTTFRLETDGKYLVYICSTLPCALRGSENIFDHLASKLGIGLNETTADGLFTLKKAECIGACGNAPAMQVNDDYYENLSIQKLDEIIDDLKEGKSPARHVTV